MGSNLQGLPRQPRVADRPGPRGRRLAPLPCAAPAAGRGADGGRRRRGPRDHGEGFDGGDRGPLVRERFGAIFNFPNEELISYQEFPNLILVGPRQNAKAWFISSPDE